MDRAACCAHERALSTENTKGYVRTHVLRLGECSFLWRAGGGGGGYSIMTSAPVTNAVGRRLLKSGNPAFILLPTRGWTRLRDADDN